MAKETVKNFKDMSLEDLAKALVEKTTDLKIAKISLKAGNLSNTNKISNLKREIARINTAINALNVEEEK